MNFSGFHSTKQTAALAVLYSAFVSNREDNKATDNGLNSNESNGSNDATDLAAIQAVLRGNPEAFARLVDRYQGVVLRLAKRYLGDEQDAADAAQEIFLKAYRALPLFSLERRFLPWLYGIALNHLRSSYRRIKPRRDRKVSLTYPAPDSRNDPASEAVAATERRRVQNAILQLPAAIREVVVLYYLEELPVAEVAEALGISRENVKSRLHRGRKLLRSKLLD